MVNGKETKDDKTKRKWYQAVKVMVTNVVLVKNPKNEEELKAVKFYLADNREVLYYAKNEETTTGILNGFETELTTKPNYLLPEFVVSNKMLIELNKACKKEQQELVMTFQEREFNEEIYYSMFKNQFESIYFKEFHKTDENLQKQLTAKKKYEAEVEMPLNN